MKIVNITKESGIPLIGHIAFGIIDRGSSCLQVRATSLCNMSCTFCSTDAGPNSTTHKTGYIVDADYLIEEVNKVVEKKGKTHINLDSVGEPASYPQLTYLISVLKKNPKIHFISMQSNGTYFTKEKIESLEKAGLDRIHLSIHSTEKNQAQELFGSKEYGVEKIMEIARHIAHSKIELVLAPVWLPRLNDMEIENLIKFAKELKCKICIQKYERYKYSRKPKGVKKESYYNFYKNLQNLEKKYNIKLIYNDENMEIDKGKSLEKPIKIGERINTEIIESGWFENQKIAAYKERAITVNNCNSNHSDKINLKVIENKNNIYLSEKL
tara:strand:+ start:799 stop:1776 length:978 start_codon:yes stop_codon:yes gene_type:complete